MKMTNTQAIDSNTNRQPNDQRFIHQFFDITVFNQWIKRHLPLLVSALWLSSCSANPAAAPRAITLQQQWTLNPGDDIAGHPIAGSLGDISIQLNGAQVQAPFDGEVELGEADGCTLYSTPEIPAYLFRLCGLSRVNYGEIKAKKAIGKGGYLSFATLRRQPDGTWVIVEPAKDVLEKALGAN